MVVLMHSPRPSENANGLFLSIISYGASPCIGLFFMLSGALLLPVKECTSIFLRKRLTKVLFPTLLWTLFYIGCNQYKGDSSPLWKELLSIPFSPQWTGVLWFMYVLIGLYLVAPIISKWLAQVSQKELRNYLLLWIVTMCYPLLNLFLEIKQDETGMLYYFSGYIGYFVLGYYINGYVESVRMSLLIPLTIIAIIVPVICKLKAWEVDFYSLFWYLSIFVVILCVMWFKLLLKLNGLLERSSLYRNIIRSVSNLSFGIYLVHIFIIHSILLLPHLVN